MSSPSEPTNKAAAIELATNIAAKSAYKMLMNDEGVVDEAKKETPKADAEQDSDDEEEEKNQEAKEAAPPREPKSLPAPVAAQVGNGNAPRMDPREMSFGREAFPHDQPHRGAPHFNKFRQPEKPETDPDEDDPDEEMFLGAADITPDIKKVMKSIPKNQRATCVYRFRQRKPTSHGRMLLRPIGEWTISGDP